MNIGEASKLSGLSTKTIRYYEEQNLLPAPSRTEAGYRDYQPNDLKLLHFLARARATGFNLDECRELIELYQNPQRQSKHVKELVLEKISHVDAQIEKLNTMRNELSTLADQCSGDEKSHCAIIDALNENDDENEGTEGANS